ncbi:hypothetical protein C2E20_5731 [Micractinium conductrix]|uniref:Uncharacterized protein n=1 Tax=Micractinium conductrix TaxID=554055 RepID=A0A2P6V9V1_9CHLO|nr:hypothetical protein C2E20_5731 [Micractinium conductrix]|eukprot:PSC70869.1 hypothetical protein C2E20_5731 [Micractinium conductrix]
MSSSLSAVCKAPAPASAVALRPRTAPAPAAPQAWRPSRRQPRDLRSPVAAGSSTSSSSAAAPPAVDSAVDTLLRAAATGCVPPATVFVALRTLESAKLPPGDWDSIIGGDASPGNRWRLVFTSGTKQVQDAIKGVGKGGGAYFPITACQRWDATRNEIENGVYLGRIAALTFQGPYRMEGKILEFDFDTLKLRLGGWTLPLPLKAKQDPSAFKRSKDSPFFVFYYVSDKIICARGRGGGIAMWARTTPQWELEQGVV